MKIAINTLGPSKLKAGVGNYVTNLIRELANLDTSNTYLIYTSKENKKYFKTNNKRLIIKDIGLFSLNKPIRVLWEQLVLPFSLLWNKIDVLHSPGFVCPIIKTTKSVVTIHDMTFFSHPKVHTFFKRIYFPLMITLSLWVSNKTISVSNNTTKDISKYVRINKKKVSTIYESFNQLSMPEHTSTDEFLRNRYNIHSKYLLFVGTLEPRKNIKSIIIALSKIKDKKVKLVIVGGKGWMYDDLFSVLKKLKLEDRVIFTGYVPDEELGSFYRNAEGFIYPSFYEGFGIPILEAMYFGCPVITSNISSMPEVAGDAAILINPKSINELTDAIDTLLSNAKLRKDMIKKGLSNVKRFSWERMARETLNVYESLR